MTWYKTGTISLTNGSAAVTGAGTSWVDAGVLNAGDILAPPDGNLYEILSIQSNTGLTLASNYLGTTAAGAAYALIPIGLLPSALAQQVKAVLVIAAAASSAAVLTTAAQGLTAEQQGNARTNIAALGAADVGAGRLSKSVAGGADVTLTATEAAAQIIECTGTLTANINLIVPAAARIFAIYNNTAGGYTVTVKTAAGTGVPVPAGLRGLVECDATNVVGLTVGAPGSVTTLAASGLTTLSGGLLSPAVAVVGTTTYTQVVGSPVIKFGNTGGTNTITLLSPATYSGMTIFVMSYSANILQSASANVVDMLGNVTTSILPAVAGKWAVLQSDGTYWRTVAESPNGNLTIPGALTVITEGSVIALGSVIAPTLLNGWVNYGGSESTVGYWKDPCSGATLQGTVANGTADTDVFILPAGYRPLVNLKFASTENNAARAVYITTAGNVHSIGAGNTELRLDGISFRTV